MPLQLSSAPQVETVPVQADLQVYSQVLDSLQIHSPAVGQEIGVVVALQSQVAVQEPPSVEDPPPQPMKSKLIRTKPLIPS